MTELGAGVRPHAVGADTAQHLGHAERVNGRRGRDSSPAVIPFILVTCGAVVLVLGLSGFLNLTIAGLISVAFAATSGAMLLGRVLYGGGVREFVTGLLDLRAPRRRRGRERDI